MDAIDEFAKYFKSGNEVPVERATIPAELAKRLIEDFERLEQSRDGYMYAATNQDS